MCLPAVPLIALAAGSILSAGSSVLAGQGQKQAANANAALAEREGQVAQTRSTLEQSRITGDRRDLAAAQTVGAASQGRTFSGSVLDVAQGSNVAGELDILSTVYGGNIGSTRAKTQANIARAGGKGAVTRGAIQGGATILGGVAKAFGGGF